MNKVTVVSIASFVLGSLPLLAFAFFSPGLDSEGPWGYIIFSFGLATFVCLIVSARRRKWIWGLVLMQVIILGLVLYETFSDAALYIGTEPVTAADALSRARLSSSVRLLNVERWNSWV